jgi:hypothetical protein
MRKVFFLVNILVLIILISCKHKENKKADLFNWLNGHWTMNTDDGMVTEEWKTVNDSLMVGKSDFVKGDSVIPFETIRIFIQDTSFYYEAKAVGQNNEQPVEFKLSSFSDSGFVAENPQHDFPKRITYKLINKDSIHAFVDGGKFMPDKRADFYYKKNKN